MSIDLDVPWVEKYRPKTFDEIVSQNVAINNLKEFVKSGNMPHLIFTGPAGTGKNSTALIIARHLLKGEDYSRNVLELNASDTVRMEFVRNVIKNFTNQNMIVGKTPLKVVILDEADNIPAPVQQALRRIIERTSTNKYLLNDTGAAATITYTFNDVNSDTYVNAGDTFSITAPSDGYYVFMISDTSTGATIFKSTSTKY